MNRQEQDRNLSSFLAAYDVPEIDAERREAFLARVVGIASVTPQGRTSGLGRTVFASRWMANVTALIVLTFLGYWSGGLVPSQAHPDRTTKSFFASAEGEAYLNNVVLGPSSWREVSL